MLGNLFQPKFFILFYDWYMNLTFSSKMYFRIYVFFVFLIITFQKNINLGNFFKNVLRVVSAILGDTDHV